MLAPLEALGWYAGSRPRRTYARELGGVGWNRGPRESGPSACRRRHYIVFLSGIGDPSAQWHYPEETEFLRRLRERLPRPPRSATCSPTRSRARTSSTTAQRSALGGLWSDREDGARQPVRPGRGADQPRNLFQVTVSVDHRYGPFFNLGQAENVRDALLAYGYRRERAGSSCGYSGGGRSPSGSPPSRRMLGPR